MALLSFLATRSFAEFEAQGVYEVDPEESRIAGFIEKGFFEPAPDPALEPVVEPVAPAVPEAPVPAFNLAPPGRDGKQPK